jgi:hypothetical protein
LLQSAGSGVVRSKLGENADSEASDEPRAMACSMYNDDNGFMIQAKSLARSLQNSASPGTVSIHLLGIYCIHRLHFGGAALKWRAGDGLDGEILMGQSLYNVKA